MSKTLEGRALTTDAEIEAAVSRAETYDAIRPRAVDVAYRRSDDKFIVTLSNDVQVVVPRKLLQGLADATVAQLKNVAIDDFGSALHWEELNVDHYVPGLLHNVFGTRKWMSEIGRKGGAVRSAAKTNAVRRNGFKGGRPRKSAGG